MSVKSLNKKEKAQFFLREEDSYSGSSPYFFKSEDYESVSILEENWTIIRDEFEDYIKGIDDLGSSSVNPPYLSNSTAWRNIYFWNFLWKDHKSVKRFPKTYKLLNSVPNLIMAEVTCLKGHSKILPHIGETNVTMRGHLGLEIPADLPLMGIQVGPEKKGWRNGKVILFSDAHRHFVWNDSDSDRYILVFDIIKQQYAHRKYWMCAQALSSLTIKYFDEKIPLFKKLPNSLLMMSHYFFSSIWRMYLPIQNKIRWLP